MSTVGYLSVAHVVLHGAAALFAYRGLRRFVVRSQMPALTACVALVAVLAVLPSLLAHAAAGLANHLFSSGVVAPEPAWDVGLAMSLFVSTWLCYAVGALAACFGLWSFLKRANAT